MTESWQTRWPVRMSLGLVAGAVMAAVDNVLFEGEVSPIVIVGMLFVATITAGMWWGWRGWVAVVAAWAWIPGSHVAKRTLGLPDTLHPNTYASILFLAAFTFGVSAIGTACGVLAHRITSGGPSQAEAGASAHSGA